MRQLKYLLVALMLLPFAAFARNAPIHDTDVAVVGNLSAKQVGEAVNRALVGRRWIISNQKGNTLEATQMTRGLMAKVAISWDAQHVTIKYLDSQGLDYEEKDGERYIHGNYNKWIGNLERDLPVFMTRVAAGQ
ncbi:hypothetical protein [Solimonas variicoloris]|uniref:hypothetical protein n=1 Tax=Solimonas variicoloris TaxID=254408 RepID=UPI00035F2E57|nr:hypothetical protein [Solimonas variicoloris]